MHVLQGDEHVVTDIDGEREKKGLIISVSQEAKGVVTAYPSTMLDDVTPHCIPINTTVIHFRSRDEDTRHVCVCVHLYT